MLKRIGFATQQSSPIGSSDDYLAREALESQGYTPIPLVWEQTTSAETLQQLRLSGIVIRSCWDYHLRQGAFLNWLSAVTGAGIPLLNSARVTRWNLDKHYLRELHSARVPIPKTVWVERGDVCDLSSLMTSHQLSEVVVKPCVSLSAFETHRIALRDAATFQAEFEALTSQRDMMVQAFVPEVLTSGEISLVFFRNQFSHAVRKVPRPGDFRVQSEHGGQSVPYVPSERLVSQAEQMLEAVKAIEPVSLTYARVDGVVVEDILQLMELELIDPFLFLSSSEGAPERFGRAIVQSLHDVS